MAQEHSAKLITHYLMSGGFVMYHRALAHAVGDHSAGLLLSQFWGWTTTESVKERDGWFYKTQAEINQETAMTRREQETARRKLRELGLLDEQMRGQPAKLWFRLNVDALMDLLQERAEEVFQTQNSQDGGKRHPSMAESANLDWRKAPDKVGGKRPTMHGGNRHTTKKQTKKQATTAGKAVVEVEPAAAVQDASLFSGVIDELLSVGFDTDAARQIAQHPNATLENVRRQVEAMQKRKASKNWHGLLRRAIEGGYGVPVDQAQREKADQDEKRRHREAQEAARKAQEEAETARKEGELRLTLSRLERSEPEAFSAFLDFVADEREKELSRPIAKQSSTFRAAIERAYTEESKKLDLFEKFLLIRSNGQTSSAPAISREGVSPQP